MSPITQNNWPKERLDKLKTLLACEDIEILTKKGGGNSLVYCVEADGKQWAVKSYPPYAPNQRDRLAAELTVYQFLNQHQVPSVPELKAYCEKERWLVMSWIDGGIPQEYTSGDIAQAIDFIRVIAQLNQSAAATRMPDAAEACLSLNILIAQVGRRLHRLQGVSAQEPALNQFLEKNFFPVLAQYQQQSQAGFAANEIPVDRELGFEKRSLIPADFGFHNTIRDPSGHLFFFDFDYFGWDDPVKLLADILWHPKMSLSAAQKRQFIDGLFKIYEGDALFSQRFYYTLPLFGLRWVLILLNEFIPEFWSNRQHAGTFQDYSHNQAKAKRIQLKRAKELLCNVQQIGSAHENIARISF